MRVYSLSENVHGIIPRSYEKAVVIASKILKSDFHKTTLCELFTLPNGKPHIDSAVLHDVLKTDDLFTVDKIRTLNTRAAAARHLDPFRIYLNPLLLLEMRDREQEAEKIATTMPISEWPNLMDKIPFWTDGPRQLVNVEHAHVEFNSLVFIEQFRAKKENEAAAKAEKSEALAKQKKERAAQVAEKAAAKTATSLPPPTLLTTRYYGSRTAPAPTEPAPKKAKVEAPMPSGLSVEEKNVIMLTVLLVHGAQHLLMNGLSGVLESGQTQEKIMPLYQTGKDTAKFTDVGHMMEKMKYKYCIHHAYSEHWPTAFAVDEILGSPEEASSDWFILRPSTAFLSLIEDPNSDVPITAETLKMTPTHTVPFKQVAEGPKLGRPSMFTCDLADSYESPSDLDDEEFVPSLFKVRK